MLPGHDGGGLLLHRAAARATRVGRRWHTLNVTSPDDLDDRIAAWLAEAYHDSPE